MLLKAAGLPSQDLAFTNFAYVHPDDFTVLQAGRTREPFHVSFKGYVFNLGSSPSVGKGTIGLGKYQRQVARIALSDDLDVKPFSPTGDMVLGSAKFEVDLVLKSERVNITVQTEEFDKFLKDNYANQVFGNGQVFCVDYTGYLLTFKVLEMTRATIGVPQEEGSAVETRGGPVLSGLFLSTTESSFVAAQGVSIVIRGNKNQTKSIFRPEFNFEQLGIGGLDKEFADIFRRAFASRIFPANVVEKLGINHVRGMLLFGPPGTGKTLIARQIAKALHAREPKIVNGPEILNKYVGQAEENIRNLFVDAEREYMERGEESQLHIIIFDEIDAICKQRGSVQNGTGVHDTVVNQLLSKIDGVNSLNNILVIGMTNRKDMIDEALLRPGRMEVHVEISLPDEQGRVQILNIHTSKARKANALGADVDIAELATRTKNFSGAEIEGLVRCATSYAFSERVNVKDISKAIDTDNIKVNMSHFNQALEEVKPAFGVDNETLQTNVRGGIISFGDSFEHLRHTCRMLIDQVRHSDDHTPLLSCLLEGAVGTGKTALACSLALESEFPFIKLISPEDCIGLSEVGKVAKIQKVFEDAYKSPLSFVVLDNLERLMEFVNIGPRFSNTILQALLVLIKRVPPKSGRRLFVIGTTSQSTVMESLEIVQAFNVVLNVPRLSRPNEIKAVLSSCNVDAAEQDRIAHSFSSPIGIKQFMLALEMARQGGQKITLERLTRCLRDCGYQDSDSF